MKYRVKVHNILKNQLGGDPNKLIRSASTGNPTGNPTVLKSGNIDDIVRLERQIYNLNEQLTIQAREIAKLQQDNNQLQQDNNQLQQDHNQLSRKISEAETKYEENIKLIKEKFEVTQCLDDGPPGQKSTEGWGRRLDINCKLATDHAGSPLQNPKIKEILYSEEEINKADQYIKDKRLIEFTKELIEKGNELPQKLKNDLALAQKRQGSRKQQTILSNALSDKYGPTKN